MIRAGDIVLIKSEEEIKQTLDENGLLEGIPFMPEMREFCGKAYRVFKRADKICVENEYFIGVEELTNTLLLDDLRCDGSAHDGCQKMCMIFWKEDWVQAAPADAIVCTAPNWVDRFHDDKESPIDSKKIYSCQSTAVMGVARILPFWDLRQYVRDLYSGSVKFWELAFSIYITFHNKVAEKLGGKAFGGVFGEATSTPSIALGLVPGEEVRIKDPDAISETLDKNGKNRGLLVNYEMLRHSGEQHRVLRRIDRMIVESNGKMRPIKNTVLLNNVGCSGVCMRGCARNSFPMWREAWLERINKDNVPQL